MTTTAALTAAQRSALRYFAKPAAERTGVRPSGGTKSKLQAAGLLVYRDGASHITAAGRAAIA
jgi:hypothetical protein